MDWMIARERRIRMRVDVCEAQKAQLSERHVLLLPEDKNGGGGGGKRKMAKVESTVRAAETSSLECVGRWHPTLIVSYSTRRTYKKAGRLIQDVLLVLRGKGCVLHYWLQCNSSRFSPCPLCKSQPDAHASIT